VAQEGTYMRKKETPQRRVNDKNFMVRMPQEEFDAVMDLAYKKDISINEWMRRAFRKAIAQESRG
jgi:predicted HicB family RNase H-like nuclease